MAFSEIFARRSANEHRRYGEYGEGREREALSRRAFESAKGSLRHACTPRSDARLKVLKCIVLGNSFFRGDKTRNAE